MVVSMRTGGVRLERRGKLLLLRELAIRRHGLLLHSSIGMVVLLVHHILHVMLLVMRGLGKKLLLLLVSVDRRLRLLLGLVTAGF